jgi:hypothetical protein
MTLQPRLVHSHSLNTLGSTCISPIVCPMVTPWNCVNYRLCCRPCLNCLNCLTTSTTSTSCSTRSLLNTLWPSSGRWSSSRIFIISRTWIQCSMGFVPIKGPTGTTTIKRVGRKGYNDIPEAIWLCAKPNPIFCQHKAIIIAPSITDPLFTPAETITSITVKMEGWDIFRCRI